MSTAFTQSLQKAEGRYLSDDELSLLVGYTKTYSTRVDTYLLVQKYAEQLITMTLQQLAQTDLAVVQQYSHLCQRDMGDVLRLSARAILKDDPDEFYEFVIWMQNMMRAVKKEAQSAYAYGLLQQVVQRNFPADCAALLNLYLQQVVDNLQAMA